MIGKFKSKLWPIIIFLVFLLIVVFIFWLYDKDEVTLVDDVYMVEQTAESPKTLNFQEDVLRFLQVYLEQPFLSRETMIEFVEIEHRRFAFYNVQTETDLTLKNNLIKVLDLIIAKIDEKDYNLETENQALSQLKNQLES